MVDDRCFVDYRVGAVAALTAATFTWSSLVCGRPASLSIIEIRLHCAWRISWCSQHPTRIWGFWVSLKLGVSSKLWCHLNDLGLPLSCRLFLKLRVARGPVANRLATQHREKVRNARPLQSDLLLIRKRNLGTVRRLVPLVQSSVC